VLKGQLDFKSEPWPKISDAAKDCVKRLLEMDASKRATSEQVGFIGACVRMPLPGSMHMPQHGLQDLTGRSHMQLMDTTVQHRIDSCSFLQVVGHAIGLWQRCLWHFVC
jgi:hypothetical protein